MSIWTVRSPYSETLHIARIRARLPNTIAILLTIRETMFVRAYVPRIVSHRKAHRRSSILLNMRLFIGLDNKRRRQCGKWKMQKGKESRDRKREHRDAEIENVSSWPSITTECYIFISLLPANIVTTFVDKVKNNERYVKFIQAINLSESIESII